MAEVLNPLYKAELGFLEGTWRDREHLEAATVDWVHWLNTRRLHSMLHYMSRAEVAADYHSTDNESSVAT